ncbi:MAG: NFACT RNA binding domain-containing protein [Eubacteriales bacterium]|nr:NFACT RNA binding domain-containing protein [Eubacteriales bacterium]
MSISSDYIAAVVSELRKKLIGGRIDKIQQPSKELIILTVRNRGVSSKLLLSASTSGARIHITNCEYENPSEPPMFCMLLRKHILGSALLGIDQPEGDRIVCLSLISSDELGRDAEKKLYIEMIPGRMNIILVGADGTITDCIYRRDYEPDLYRRVFPGMIYRLPKRPEGFRPSEAQDPSEKPGERSRTAEFTSSEFDSVSAFLDAYYSEREKKELYRRKTKELRASLISARKRIEKKLSAQKIELQNAASREQSRRYADLITANIYRIRKGDTFLVCEDYYEEGCSEKEIPLDPLLTPQANASRLYKDYNRKKTAEEYLSGLIEKAEQQLDYIGSALYELDLASTDAEIEGIREELVLSGVIRSRLGNKKGQSAKNAKNKKVKKPTLDYISTVTDNGLDILVGRNNLQNEELTFHIARKTDIWFHVKDFHGSHVILRTLGSAPEESDILQAAKLAVRYSQAGMDNVSLSGGKVAVDYTEIRYVKKRSGTLPGNVTFTNQTTIFV